MTLSLDPDRRLALAYVPAAARQALEALWRLDVALASVLATGRDPAVSQIRLAWWCEALERLDREAAPPEPVLQAIARHILPTGLSGAALAAMEEGWAILLPKEKLLAAGLAAFAALRGGLLFRHSAFLLGAPEPRVERAGEMWALTDLARHSADPGDARAALSAARERIDRWRWPRRLRPLGMLAALAGRDAAGEAGRFERQGSPARMARMIRHQLTGH
jgi:phytoene synthase